MPVDLLPFAEVLSHIMPNGREKIFYLAARTYFKPKQNYAPIAHEGAANDFASY